VSQCDSPIDEATLVDYLAGELSGDDESRVEDHLFACDACGSAAHRLSNLIEALRDALPPTVSRAALARLEGRGMRLLQTRIAAGTRAVVTFGKDVDLLVHRLQLDVGDAQRIDCEVVNAADGSPIIAFADVPFERTGEINLVCHRHYAEAFPPDASIRLLAVDGDERRVLGQFGVMHVVI
jgi:hypothetical protein